MDAILAITILLALIGAGTVAGAIRDAWATCANAGEED